MVSYQTPKIILEQHQISSAYWFCKQGTRGFWYVHVIGEVCPSFLVKSPFSSLLSLPDLITSWLSEWLMLFLKWVKKAALTHWGIVFVSTQLPTSFWQPHRKGWGPTGILDWLCLPLHLPQMSPWQWGEARAGHCRDLPNIKILHGAKGPAPLPYFPRKVHYLSHPTIRGRNSF